MLLIRCPHLKHRGGVASSALSLRPTANKTAGISWLLCIRPKAEEEATKETNI